MCVILINSFQIFWSAVMEFLYGVRILTKHLKSSQKLSYTNNPFLWIILTYLGKNLKYFLNKLSIQSLNISCNGVEEYIFILYRPNEWQFNQNILYSH